MKNRAHSLLTVKAVREGDRVLRGIATTPTPDREGDVVEPLGVKFTNPMPLLWQHRHDKPVGTVKFSAPTAVGIEFEATLPLISEPGVLKDRVDEAWQSVTHGLVAGVSIGFRPLEYSLMEGGGYRFLESEIYELSLVTIPANAEATLQLVKSLDVDLAPSGRLPSPSNPAPSAEGQAVRVVKLHPAPKDKPFVIRRINR